MKNNKPIILELIKKTPGKRHSWVKAVGKSGYITIRKENKNVVFKKAISSNLRSLIEKKRIPFWRRVLNFILRRG